MANNMVKSEIEMVSKRRFQNLWTLEQIEEIETEYTWVVKNVDINHTHAPLTSPEFSKSSLDKHKWSLRLTVGANKEEFFNVQLQWAVNTRFLDPATTMVVDFEITLKNADGIILAFEAFKKKQFKSGCFSRLTYGGSYLRRKDVGSLLPSKELHIQCKIIQIIDKKTITGSFINCLPVASNSLSIGSLTSRFEQLFNQGMAFNDVKLCVKGTNFPAHKVVLATGK